MFQDILRGAAGATGGSSSIQVLSVDVYGPNANTSTFDVAAGVVAAVNGGANIINLSLGSPADSQLLHDLLQQVTAKGIPVFAAAGNSASPQPYYPAAYPEVISVTAANNGQLASYANYGSYIKLILPGSAVVYFNNNAYVVSGTSTSSALTSGLAAGAADSSHISTGAAANALLNTPKFQFTLGK
jgi:ABC-type sugar transport system substrate-binding protein